MKTIRNIIRGIALICGLLAVMLIGAENPDGSVNLGWSLSCIAFAALSFFVASLADVPEKK